jgi:hypothetical protein
VRTTLACLLAAVCLRLACPRGAAAAPDEEKKAVPLYTNADLERVSPYRDETGVNSKPAAAPLRDASPATRGRARGEDYWRREADRLRDRVRPLREQAADLRLRIEERRRRPGVRPYSDPQIVALERRAQMVEERIREMESRLEDRARREGALPGWMR